MKPSAWIKTPPQVHGKLVRLRYKNIDSKKVHQGLFSWSDSERTFIECVAGPDSLALYTEDGWRVVAWQEYREKRSVSCGS